MSDNASADSVDGCKEMCVTLQCMIEISAENLEGLRTQCLTSAVLTQQEIRRIEGKLIKLFGGQLLARGRIPADQLLASGCAQYPSLQLWLRVVGLSNRSAHCVGERCASLQWLLALSETQLVTFLQPLLAEPAELHRLVRAVNNLNKYIELETEGSGGSNPELLLFWDSWQSATTANSNLSSSAIVSSPALNRRRCTSSSSDKAGSWQPASTAAAGSSPADLRRASSPVQIHALTTDRTQVSVCDPAAPSITGGATYNSRQTRVCPSPASAEDTSVGTCAGHQRHASLTPVSSYHLVASPDQQLQLDSAAELSASPDDSGGDGAAGRSGGSSSYSPVVPHTPRSPRTPTFPGSMSHVINHVFVKTFNVSTCDYCKKQMIYGLRCRECRYKCHRHCEQLVPPSCGLPRKFVDFFIDQVQSQGSSSPNLVDGRLARFSGGRRRSHRSALSGSLHTFGDSSSTTSSCTSTAPSSPAFPQVGTPSPAAVVVPDRFHFPEVSPSTAARMSVPSGADPLDFSSALYSGTPRSQRPLQRLPAVDAVGTDGSTSTLMSGSSTVTTDSEHTLPCRMDSQDSTNSEQDTMSRQDSLSLREWDIPFEEVRLDEVIGSGRFGQVHRGHWHGEVAVKLLPMEDDAALDRFKQDVATFRKTRHDNLVLFMGACVCPPRLAIITSYCRGKTLYALLHGLKEKFNLTKIANIARHISLGMGYLHARGIVHKDLKTKNIFVDNAGTVVITDFGLSSLTRPCRSTAWDQLQVPRGWLCYLSPEIIRCLRTEDNSTLPFSTASDVYAFGTVWYELLSGEWPWRSQPAESVIWLVGQGMKQSLANIQASRDVKDVLLRCWNFHQQDRLDFVGILSILGKLPKKRLTRSPSHPIQLSRSVESVF